MTNYEIPPLKVSDSYPVSPCDHTNPVCECWISDAKRAELLRDWIEGITGEWPDIQLMPLNNDKSPAIQGNCRLDSDEADRMLHTPREAIEAVRDGHNGFFVYAGRESHGTDGMVICDRDAPDTWPELPPTLRVVSGSGTGDHLYFRSDGVKNANGKGEIPGDVKAENVGCVTPGSIHSSGGIYHMAENPGIETLSPDDLPPELLPADTQSRNTDSEMPDFGDVPDTVDPRECFDIENDIGLTLREIREFSPRLDRLLTVTNPKEYPSPSEADYHAIGLLLYYRFDESDVARIVQGFRARPKQGWKWGEYVRHTLERTSVSGKCPALLLSHLVLATPDHSRPPVSGRTIREVVEAIQNRDDPITVSELTDSDAIPYRDGVNSRKSRMQRIRRALNNLSGYYLRKEKSGREYTYYRKDNFPELVRWAKLESVS